LCAWSFHGVAQLDAIRTSATTGTRARSSGLRAPRALVGDGVGAVRGRKAGQSQASWAPGIALPGRVPPWSAATTPPTHPPAPRCHTSPDTVTRPRLPWITGSLALSSCYRSVGQRGESFCRSPPRAAGAIHAKQRRSRETQERVQQCQRRQGSVLVMPYRHERERATGCGAGPRACALGTHPPRARTGYDAGRQCT
jgi:hypothetical protein